MLGAHKGTIILMITHILYAPKVDAVYILRSLGQEGLVYLGLVLGMGGGSVGCYVCCALRLNYRSQIHP